MLRSDIKKTPGRLVFDSVSLYSKLKTFIEARPVSEMFAVGTDGHGELDQRQREYYYRVNITPDGRLDAAIAAMLWPYGNFTKGQGILSDTDAPLVIHGADSSLTTFKAAALETMPNLRFSSIETLIQQATFLAVRGHTTGALDEWDTANSLITQAGSGGTMADAGFAPTGIITQPYVANWGAKTGFTDVDTIDGLNVEFNVTFADDTTDRRGMINRRIDTVQARVRCSPLGPTRQQILDAMEIQGTGAGRGKSRQANGDDFSITGDDGETYFTLFNAILVDQVERWGTEQIRVGDVAWMATRTFSAGTPGPLFEVLP